MLWHALGAAAPTWAHVPVLVNEQRKKLSKRRDKVAVEQYRDEGILADAMVNYLMTLGWAPQGDTEIVPWQRIVEEFRLEDVNHSPAFFDIQKLLAFNGEYIRAMSIDDFITACWPVLARPSVPWPATKFDTAKFAAMAELVQTRVQVLADVPSMVDFLFLDEPVIDDAAWTKATKDAWARDVLVEMATACESCNEWNAANLKAALEAITESRELKLGKTQAPVRVAVTGRSVGPPLFESLEVLGRDSTLGRLRAAIARL
jgi:glutamyl-tRNA synthetase